MTGITQSPKYRELHDKDLANSYDLFDFAKKCNLSQSSFASKSGFRWSNSVQCSSNSVRFFRVPSYHPTPERISKRGVISGFSRHSRLRLRQALADACLASSDTFGLTLTLPWQHADDDVLARYRECFNRFSVAFRRRFPFSACIFRHELQQRKMPHCHLVVFLAFADIREGQGLKDLQQEFFLLWLRALNGFLGGGSLVAFARHGVKLDHLANKDAMFRYISDHASKSKQAQLGYKGKQWGFINRALLSNRVKIRYVFRSQADLWFFQRHIAKCCRFFVKAPCVFGRKLSVCPNCVSVNFVRHSTVRRIIRYIEKNRFAVLREYVSSRLRSLSDFVRFYPWDDSFRFSPLLRSRSSFGMISVYVNFSSFCCCRRLSGCLH